MQERERVGLYESEEYRVMKARCGDIYQMDDVQQSFDLVLSENPYYGDRVPFDHNLYILITTPFPPRVPSYRVLYRYCEEEDRFNIELLAIEPITADEE